MRAAVGDRLVLASGVVDGAVREGRVVEVRHPDGSPPYLVEWSDTGERTLVFPGPDAHVQSAEEQDAHDAPEGGPSVWQVRVSVRHDGRETTADAVLLAGQPQGTHAVGRSHRDPADAPAPVIGEEVAVARALRRLADQLMSTAQEAIGSRPG